MGRGVAAAPWSLRTPAALWGIGLYLCLTSLLFYHASLMAHLAPHDAAGVPRSHIDLLSAACPLVRHHDGSLAWCLHATGGSRPTLVHCGARRDAAYRIQTPQAG